MHPDTLAWSFLTSPGYKDLPSPEQGSRLCMSGMCARLGCATLVFCFLQLCGVVMKLWSHVIGHIAEQTSSVVKSGFDSGREMFAAC